MLTEQQLEKNLKDISGSIIERTKNGYYYENFSEEKARAFLKYLFEYTGVEMPPNIEIYEGIYEFKSRIKELGSDSIHEVTGVGAHQLLELSLYKTIKDSMEIETDIGPTLDRFVELNEESGICYMNVYEDRCIICKYPKKVYTDDEGEVHNDDGPAAEWGDGFYQYFTHGNYIKNERT